MSITNSCGRLSAMHFLNLDCGGKVLRDAACLLATPNKAASRNTLPPQSKSVSLSLWLDPVFVDGENHD